MTAHDEGVLGGTVDSAHFCAEDEAREVSAALVATREVDAVVLPEDGRKVETGFV